jgi:hypothetical protein
MWPTLANAMNPTGEKPVDAAAAMPEKYVSFGSYIGWAVLVLVLLVVFFWPT